MRQTPKNILKLNEKSLKSGRVCSLGGRKALMRDPAPPALLRLKEERKVATYRLRKHWGIKVGPPWWIKASLRRDSNAHSPVILSSCFHAAAPVLLVGDALGLASSG